MNRCAWLAALLMLGLAPLVHGAQAQTGTEKIRKQLEQYAAQQLAGQPGAVSIQVGEIDPQLKLEPCQRMESFVPSGGRLWGKTTLGARCAAGANWVIYVPVTVSVQAPVVVAARPVAHGRVLAAEDLTLQTLDLTQLPAGVLTDVAAAIGQTLNVGLLPGYPVRQDMLRAPLVIRQGQSVRLVAQGGGFGVSAEGKALGNAAAGQTVQVRTTSGQTVSGIARPDGSVEVRF
jgi:flagella basal body P-ring formation protein FlgA